MELSRKNGDPLLKIITFYSNRKFVELPGWLWNRLKIQVLNFQLFLKHVEYKYSLENSGYHLLLLIIIIILWIIRCIVMIISPWDTTETPLQVNQFVHQINITIAAVVANTNRPSILITCELATSQTIATTPCSTPLVLFEPIDEVIHMSTVATCHTETQKT